MEEEPAQLCKDESIHLVSGGASTMARVPQRVRCRSGRRFRFVFRWSGVESSEAQRQESSAPSIGEEAEVADADEALGEQVKQEAAQELITR